MNNGEPQWSVLATSPPTDERRRILKHNECFAVFDLFGDISTGGLHEAGLYKGDTRHLSGHQLWLEGRRPLYLNSAVKRDNGLFIIELMNPDLDVDGQPGIPKGSLHIFRAKVLRNQVCYEHLRIVNFGLQAVTTHLTILFEADFADIFEVRGFRRAGVGQMLPPRFAMNELGLAYRGLDQRMRRTRILFDPPPQRLVSGRADFVVDLAAGGVAHFYFSVVCEEQGEPPPAVGDYHAAFAQNGLEWAERAGGHGTVATSNPLVNFWIDRSAGDLDMLNTALRQGPYPYAGLPWFATTFGRDGILTAHQTLWLDPNMARGVLAFLADTQASEFEPERDAEPGKILHEARLGEVAALAEVPFRRYYGSVDATPLFVGLAGAYYRRTGDIGFIGRIWPHVKQALDWIDCFGDVDGDGFVEYIRGAGKGLVQQGWKDSHDSIFHADGGLAEAPIALCEVQGYVYDARLQAAMLADVLGDTALAQIQRKQAEELKRRFNASFWCEEIGSYALALDGAKRPCAVPASNAGHALWSGIAEPALAARVAERLFRDDFFCGWGIRTVARGSARYNPMSYHNGSVWPHDNALIAAGLARYGFTDKALTLFAGLMQASQFVDQHRMPELFCGFARRPDEGPTLYPVACLPQAWSAAAVFGLLQACLGVSFHPDQPEICFHHPRLPSFLDTVEIHGLVIGTASLDLSLQRYPNNVAINLSRKQGHVRIVVIE